MISEELWKTNSYVSSCVRFDSDDEQSEDEGDEDTGGLRLEDEAEDDKGQTSRAIHYVSGDVTQPVKTKTSVNLIVHCAGTGNLKKWRTCKSSKLRFRRLELGFKYWFIYTWNDLETYQIHFINNSWHAGTVKITVKNGIDYWFNFTWYG